MAQDQGQADTIEITPAMIEAGVGFLRDLDGIFSEGIRVCPRSVQALLQAALIAGGYGLRIPASLPQAEEIAAQFELSH
jgi:hypothetical protein